MDYEEIHTTVYKYRSMGRRKFHADLREPLYAGPPGSPPPADPATHGIDNDLARIRRERTQYLPPYRYDNDDKVRNVYRSSEEAYCTIAKNLLFQFECGRDISDVHEIIKKNLTPTQRKFFADAHMEKAMDIPAQSEEGEPSIFAIVRRIDVVFGVVLLEYYASSDGNLFAAQIDSINRALAKLSQALPSMAQNGEERDSFVNRIDGVYEEERDEKGIDNEHDLSVAESESDDPEEQNLEKSPTENDNSVGETTFEKIYNDATSGDGDSSARGVTTDETVKSASTMTHLLHSQLRQELLKEIMQISEFLRSTKDKDQKILYEEYLDTLRKRFNNYAKHKGSSADGHVMKITCHNHSLEDINRANAEDPVDDDEQIMDTFGHTQSLENVNRVNTDDPIPMPSDNEDPLADNAIPSQEGQDDMEHLIRVDTIDEFPMSTVEVNRTPDKENESPTMNTLLEHEVTMPNKEAHLEFNEANDMDIYEKGLEHQSLEVKRVTELESGLKNIQLVAPISMKEGFTYVAKYRKRKFLARVPRGGVQKGQTFVTPMLNPAGSNCQFVCYETQLESMNVPYGRWRDGLFNCFQDPLLLLALFFPLVALSQISSRMEFIETGNVHSSYGVRFLLFLTVAIVSVNAWLFVALFLIIGNPPLWLILVCSIPVVVLDILMIASLILKTVRMRRQIKKHYDIEEGAKKSQNNLGKDIAIGIFCSCCAISQMGRHTADYSTFREQTLTSTGLPKRLQKLIPVHTFKE